MKKIKFLKILNLLFLFTYCNGQEKKDNLIEDIGKDFVIGRYRISPKLKQIGTYTEIGGVNWDGYEYRKDSKINYGTTTLLILGDCVFFKEYFPFDFNLDKLKIIYRDEFYFICRDDKNIYYTSSHIKTAKIDISDYETVNDFIYKSRNGTLYFLDIERYKLTPIEIDIDVNSVKHLTGNYYFDKNGLYFFGAHFKVKTGGYYDTYEEKSEKLVDAQNVVPSISKRYISFNNEVFAIHDNKIKKLNIDAKKIVEINIGSSESFITDGKTVYSNMYYGYDVGNRNEKGYYGIWYPTLFSDITVQKIYSPLLHFVKENNSIVFNKNNPNNFQGLILKIASKNYLLSQKKKYEIDKMLFYHPENRTTDIFDEKNVKIYNIEGFIQYKNVLYFDGMTVKTSKLNMENLREIENSNYLTDGKHIFYCGNITGYGSQEINSVQYVIFDDRILEGSFTKEMKPINRDLLSDGITIISYAQKANIKDLNIDVKIIN